MCPTCIDKSHSGNQESGPPGNGGGDGEKEIPLGETLLARLGASEWRVESAEPAKGAKSEKVSSGRDRESTLK